MAKVTKNDVLSYLETANMLEISDLISEIEEKFGVSAAAPMAVAGAAAPAAGGAEPWCAPCRSPGWPPLWPRRCAGP